MNTTKRKTDDRTTVPLIGAVADVMYDDGADAYSASDMGAWGPDNVYFEAKYCSTT